MQDYQLLDISREFFSIALKNDALLKRVNNTGIFFMPEIAYVFECGLFISMNKSALLGNRDYQWVRERDFGYGPTDCLFLHEDKTKVSIAIEFKMDNGIDAYLKDIEKLRKLESPDHKFIKLFCSYKHLFVGQEEDYLKDMQDAFKDSVRLIKSDTFRTNNGNPNKDICLFTLWEVDSTKKYKPFLHPNFD